MLKTFSGTWFEFQHHNKPEGKYWNPVCRRFTADQWKAKVDEMAGLGMKYIVLMCSSLVYEEYAESYFDSGIYPFAASFTCTDPIEALLSRCDDHGMKVFVGAGFYGVWTHTYENMTSKDVTARAFKAMERLLSLYGHHKSFYGWYYPDETGINGYYDEAFIKYVNTYSAFAHTLRSGMKTLIAPYGTNYVTADGKFVSQLESMDVDIIAYQDEIGVRKSQPEDTAAYYEALRIAHDKAGRSALWADMEAFEFEGDVYKSALIPAEISRIERQLRSVSPYVDEVLIYQYLGMFNKPSTIAFCGHPDSVAYYESYDNFRKAQK